ncbi:MAG: hypothetical protein V4736_13785 [Bdellovibrionota bacterium]
MSLRSVLIHFQYLMLLILLTAAVPVWAASSCNVVLAGKYANTGKSYQFEMSLIRDPNNAIKPLREKIIRGESVHGEFSETLKRINSDITEAMVNFRGPVKDIAIELMAEIDSGLENGATIYQVNHWAMKYSLLMDINLGKDPAVWKEIRRGGYPANKLAYYETKLKEMEESATSLRTLFSHEQTYGPGSVLPIPTFKSLSFEDMLRTPSVSWLGLSNKMLFFDGYISPPSSYFGHDLSHNVRLRSAASKASSTTGIPREKMTNEMYQHWQETFSISGVRLSEYIRRIPDEKVRTVIHVFLFEYFHENELPMSLDQMLTFFVEIQKRQKDGYYRSSVTPGYLSESFAKTSFERIDSGFYGDDIKAIGNKLNRNERAAVHGQIIEMLTILNQ